MANKPHDVIVFDEFVQDGENRSRGYHVGVAFPNKNGDGFNVSLIPGIALSGRFSILPRRQKDDAAS